ncbi:Uncharacterised protein [Mycolicibacterium flavescens]|uniref:hypothetical protein n=1 Tax=Mycobacterium neumannii TaxID=2048551 RepID=UPI000B93E622|nr:hypothetical protein [Mycobacterium neumannii]VEG42730.1 Uncharacterised protein [Mycolicibacterium flavescens]
MSGLEALQAEVQGFRDQAGQLSDDFQNLHTEVETDRGLTVEGRRQKLAPLHAQVVEQLAALHRAEKSAVKREKERIEKRLFGLTGSSNDPARLDSFRTAQDRARKLDDADEAEAVYQSALRSDDTVLARAVLEQALTHGWTRIKEDFIERNHGTRRDLDDLAALAKYENNSLMNTAHYMPPSLNLPHSAGFQRIGGQTTAATPRGVPSLKNEMEQRVAGFFRGEPNDQRRTGVKPTVDKTSFRVGQGPPTWHTCARA